MTLPKMRLVLATVCIVATAEDRALPHVVAGHYDRTWEPDETTSLGELRRSISRSEAWAGVLVAALDDTGDDPCASGAAGDDEARIALRSAQR